MAAIIENKMSSEWLAIKGYCENSLADLRAENDNELSEKETSILRGKIAFAKEILDLGKNEQDVEISDTKYID